MTDECCFTREGVKTFHNAHCWADVNPHAIYQGRFQNRFSFNVWAEIIDFHLVGPYIFPNRLTGTEYLNFLQVHLPGLLEEIPLRLRRIMWFMHDCSLVHFT